MQDVTKLSMVLWYVMALAIATMAVSIIFEEHFQRQLRKSLGVIRNAITAAPLAAYEVENLRSNAFWFRIRFYLIWLAFLFLSAMIFSA